MIREARLQGPAAYIIPFDRVAPVFPANGATVFQGEVAATTALLGFAAANAEPPLAPDLERGFDEGFCLYVRGDYGPMKPGGRSMKYVLIPPEQNVDGGFYAVVEPMYQSPEQVQTRLLGIADALGLDEGIRKLGQGGPFAYGITAYGIAAALAGRPAVANAASFDSNNFHRLLFGLRSNLTTAGAAIAGGGRDEIAETRVRELVPQVMGPVMQRALRPKTRASEPPQTLRQAMYVLAKVDAGTAVGLGRRKHPPPIEGLRAQVLPGPRDRALSAARRAEFQRRSAAATPRARTAHQSDGRPGKRT